ncbi:cytochrome c1 [Stakelama sediminis]|uniref:Cytochrome c1 n=1 Tax=Stakelama sediminis TaxID=463200 RepID=A0A840Z2D5_9SPHN|nr:cytochrome c1 [Stakelama sediminis]MBB5720053.1 ubiquinol-cytochrome c reductase cytochrome c1 subunit [Stakelama sediminis]
MGSLFLRNLNYFIGAAFVVMLVIALVGTVSGLVSNPPQETVDEAFHVHPTPLHLESDGPFGKFNDRQLQRGFQVYKEVCSACHSLKHVAFRNLEDIGYSEGQVKTIAAEYQVPTFDPKTGDRDTRPGVPADTFPIVYYPGQGSPPDLSMIAKAREGGAAYIHALITGYRNPKTFTKDGKSLMKEFPDFKVPDGLHFNPYFANLNIAMPPPLTKEGQVQYMDGTRPTIDQMSKDVAAFLVWAAEPKLEARHRAGVAAVIFLLIFIGLAFGAYKNIWRDIKH